MFMLEACLYLYIIEVIEITITKILDLGGKFSFNIITSTSKFLYYINVYFKDIEQCN